MDAVTLEALQRMSQTTVEQRIIDQTNGKTGYRLEALREAAIGVGARGGLISQASVNQKALDSVKRELDTIYDFAPLMIKGRVIPPVLTETRDIYTQGDSATLRLAGASYKVEAQARFSSRPPQWRDYLSQSYGALTMPSSALLPRNAEEQQVWQKAVAEGWVMGQQQAKDILRTNINRLNRDYVGMVRYHILAHKRMVTIPVVAELNMPINTTGDTMHVDEKLLRITALPKFNPDISNWKPLIGEVEVLQRPGGEVAEEGGK